MNNRIITGLLALLLITTLLIVGCGGETTTTSPETTSPATTPPTPSSPTTPVPTSPSPSPASPTPTSPTTEATTPPTTSDETLGDILGRSAGIASLQYDLVITAPGTPTMTQAVWVKKNKMRMEITQQGQESVVLVDNDAMTMYTYMPAQNMAMKMSWEPTTKSAVDEIERYLEYVKEEAQSLTEYNPTVIGTETIDGKVCTVVQYSIDGQTMKMWLWKDHGIPIRVEVTTNQGLTVMEYKNIQFVDIPDSMFTLPEGVQIIQMPGG